MRSATNFFLTNLAIADLMVAFFCVYQNLSLYIFDYEWAFGEALCKMYHFVHALAYTASVLIMVLIAVERYIAIVYPIKAKSWLRMSRLRIVIIGIWLLSALICSPRLIMFGMVWVPGEEGLEAICIMNQRLYSPKFYNLTIFSLLFALPVSVMTCVYFKLGARLYSTDVNEVMAMTRINRKNRTVSGHSLSNTENSHSLSSSGFHSIISSEPYTGETNLVTTHNAQNGGKLSVVSSIEFPQTGHSSKALEKSRKFDDHYAILCNSKPVL